MERKKSQNQSLGVDVQEWHNVAINVRRQKKNTKGLATRPMVDESEVMP
jgi:hypothetical protein